VRASKSGEAAATGKVASVAEGLTEAKTSRQIKKRARRAAWQRLRSPTQPVSPEAVQAVPKPVKTSAFGATIRELRVHRGWSQEALGREIARTGSAVSFYESGERKPDLTTLRRLSAVLKIPLTRLLDLL